MKKAIITGANGFVGTALVKELVSQGVEVYGIVWRNTMQLPQIPGITWIRCNMDEYERLPIYIEDREIDVFYHLAWEGTAGVLRSDTAVQLHNIEGSCAAVCAATKLGCEKFIFASSIMQYEIEALMKSESGVPASSIYSIAKIATDYMCRTVANRENVEYVSALISNIYGPGEKSPRLINSSIRKMQKGEHISFSDGTQLYDFIYITDAAKAFSLLGEKGKNNKIYYIGNRQPRPLREFLLEMRDIVAPDLEIGLGELPFHGISLTYHEFDTEAIYHDTEFTAKISFQEGIKRTLAWIQKEESKDANNI